MGGLFRCSAIAFGLYIAVAAQAQQRPNIVLILADDLGYSDTAPFGSEINTPTISALAEQGLRFSNYHTAASCAPTRAMLLTGVDSHRAGVPNIPEMIPDSQRQRPGYQGVLGDNVVTVATLLQDAGYHTFISGKWHLGQTPDKLPNVRGFERTVVMADSGADNWEQKPYVPIYERANWFADGERFDLPGDFYSSEFLVDKLIGFIDDQAASERPYFAYLSFQAVHIPVQAPAEYTAKYESMYQDGWQALREQRLASAVEAGLVPANTALVDMPTTASWDELSDEDKRYNAKRMAVYGGMVEAMDFHIGRLVDYLKRTGQYDNTVFIFTSDNGAEASGFHDQTGPRARIGASQGGYNVDIETLGEQGSFNTIGPSWASAAASPLSYYKFYAGEGGMRVPLIIAGNGIGQQNSQTDAFSWVTDITPTILDLAGVSAPTKHYGGRKVEPIIGRSLVPLLRGEAEQVYGANDYAAFELAGNAALFQGDYKIVINRGPVGDSRWYLYNLAQDPGETNDLSAAEPQRLQQMLGLYEQYTMQNSVLPVPQGYDAQRQLVFYGLRQRFADQIIVFLLALLVLVPAWAVYRYSGKRS